MTTFADNAVGPAHTLPVEISAAAHLAAERAMPCRCRPTYSRHGLHDPECAHLDRDRLTEAVAAAAVEAFATAMATDLNERADLHQRLARISDGNYDRGAALGLREGVDAIRTAATAPR